MSKIMDELRAKEIAARLLDTNLFAEEISTHTGLSINCIKALITNKSPQ